MSSNLTSLTKYWQVIKLSWEDSFVYRTSLALWRIRQVLSTVMVLTIWNVIFGGSGAIEGYTAEQMTTYIFIVAIFQNIILASILNGLASEIYSGYLSLDLLKPLNIFYYLAARDIADKAKNVSFVIVETIGLALIFHPVLLVPSLAITLSTLGLVILGTLLNFLVTLLFGAIGFWSPDAWAPRFLFFMIVDFVAGRMYPLDILPAFIKNVFFLTPFPYLSFVQTQIYLGRISLKESLIHYLIISLWIAVLGYAVKKIWQKGLRNYEAVGQ